MVINLPEPKVIIPRNSSLFKEFFNFLLEKYPTSEDCVQINFEMDRLSEYEDAYKMSLEIAELTLKGKSNMKETTKERLKILRDRLDPIKGGTYFSELSKETEQWFDTFDLMFAIDNAIELIEKTEEQNA